jgi:hypothetical protein
VRVDDLESALRFHGEGFGLERIPAPSFGLPVVRLRAGSLHPQNADAGRATPFLDL